MTTPLYILAGIGALVCLVILCVILYVLLCWVNWEWLRYVDPRYWRCRWFHRIDVTLESRPMPFGAYYYSRRLKCAECKTDYGRAPKGD